MRLLKIQENISNTNLHTKSFKLIMHWILRATKQGDEQERREPLEAYVISYLLSKILRYL